MKRQSKNLIPASHSASVVSQSTKVGLIGGDTIKGTMELDTFTKAYLEAIAFTECHSDNPELQGKEFSPELIAQAQKDCAKFQAENDLTDYPTDRAAHDFWFTRNHHGCGFWEVDFGTLEQCTKLTVSAHQFGERYIYAGDDGMIHMD